MCLRFFGDLLFERESVWLGSWMGSRGGVARLDGFLGDGNEADMGLMEWELVVKVCG